MTVSQPMNLAQVKTVRLSVLSDMVDRPAWLESTMSQAAGILRRKAPLYIPVTANGNIHPAVAEWARRYHSVNTASAYASDVALFFRWLGPGNDWLAVRRAEINDFMDRRRFGASGDDDLRDIPAEPVSASTLARNLVAIRSLYDVAVGLGIISGNPVPSGRINATKGQLSADVNWLTRRAYDRWRSEGLLGIGSARGESLMMRERNTAYADLLYHTGLRRTEGAGLLTFEIPSADFSTRLVSGRVPASLSKGSPSRGRMMYLDRATHQSITSYVTGAREVEVAFGLRSGIYEQDADPLILKEISRRGGIPTKVLVSRPARAGEERWWRLDDLTLAQRTRMYALDEEGRRRPLMVWLGTGGKPVGVSNWNTVFKSASARTAGSRGAWGAGLAVLDDTTIRVHPHMLRHSFALYVFALAAHMEMCQRGALTPGAFDSMVRSQNIWLRVQT
ncbi:site-specific integrase, partial [Dietzia cinnamea]